MKSQLFIIVAAMLYSKLLLAQNVGIGTATPQKLLSVKGSILIDAGNENFGTIDSAALRFGTATGVGIFSAKSGAVNVNGLTFYTNNSNRIVITNFGDVGIGNVSPGYKLDVNGSIRAAGTLYAAGTLIVDGLTYVNNNAYFYDNLYVADYMAIGATPSASYKLNVNGNLLVQTNIGVDGTARIDGKLTNEGKGIVLSNSATTLRSGFNAGTYSYGSMASGSFVDVTFIITPFSGSNSNVRVMVAQFVPGTGATNWGGIIFTPHSVDAVDGAYNNQSTVKVRMYNASSSAATMGQNAVLYLYSVVTN